MNKVGIELVEEDFKLRKLRINLPILRLVQCTVNKPMIFTGAGVIWQEPDGSLRLSFFPHEPLPHWGPGTELFNPLRPAGQVGKIIPRNTYYSLSGSDSLGLSWKSRCFLPHVEFGRDRTVITADLRELRVFWGGQLTTDNYIELEAYEDIEFPCNAGTSSETKTARGVTHSSSSFDAAVVKACGMQLVFEKDEGSFTCYLTNTERWPIRRIVSRITESLQFVLARPVYWGRRTVGRRGVKVSRLVPSFDTDGPKHFRPPLSTRVFDQTGCFWFLFGKYLAVISKFRGRNWHPLSVRAYGVIKAAEGSIDALALTLSTAVEGITISMLSSLSASPASILPDLDQLVGHIQKWDGFQPLPDNPDKSKLREALKKRVEGLLGTLRRPRVNDIFNVLISRQVIDPAHVEAWKKLRHPRAHGGVEDALDLHALVHDVGVVTSLYYRVIFTAIGYNGKYVDYGSPGWPVRDHLTPVSLLQKDDLELHIHNRGPAGSKEPEGPSPENRSKWAKTMKIVLEQQPDVKTVNAQFDTDLGTLCLQVYRFGMSFAAGWTAGPDRSMVAVTTFLRGEVGADDTAAVAAFRHHPTMAGWSDEKFVTMQTEQRPNLCTNYFDPNWHASGIIQAAAEGLVVAANAAGGDAIRLLPPLTPEQEEAADESLKRVERVSRTLFNNWLDSRGPLPYQVRASKKIKDLSADDLADIRFIVGTPDGDGEEMSADELYSTFLLIAKFAESAKTAKEEKREQFRVELVHSPKKI
ncbi:MAG TPA: hypothetical protein VG722_04190, partial [Tepidisphaeraceae bacterium]|nr:hypothetical protein [Tepidisphaeraceae bacterium]